MRWIMRWHTPRKPSLLVHTAELVNFLSALGASAAFLALTVLAASRGRRDPVARSLGILCVDMCAYCSTEALKTAKVVGLLPADHLWDWINNGSAALSVVLFYHLVATFVGRRRALRAQLVAAYSYFGALTLVSLSPIVVARAAPLSGGTAWAGGMLIGMIAIVGHGVVSCSHATCARRPPKRRRGHGYWSARRSSQARRTARTSSTSRARRRGSRTSEPWVSSRARCS